MDHTPADLKDNPLLASEGLPPFDRVTAEHIVPAVGHLLAESTRQIEQLERNVEPTWQRTVKPLEEIGRRFEYTWGPVSHLFGVKNSPELRQAYESVLGDVVSFGLRVKQSEPLYRAMKSLKESPQWSSLDEPQRRILDRKLRAAELAGIALSGEQRRRFNEIVQELSQLSTQFANHLLDATQTYSLILTEKDDVDGLPQSLLQLAAQSYNENKQQGEADATTNDGPWRITLEVPLCMPFLQHCRRRNLREQVYRAYILRASEGQTDNCNIIRRILKLRREKSELLGYKTFAELSLADKMAPDVPAVYKMFESLQSAARAPARQDLEDLKHHAAENGVTEELEHWDIAFWSERLREQRFDYTDEQLRPYFALERVLEGLFGLVNRLFGISVKQAEGGVSTWHKDVRFFQVFDECGGQIAAFYLDPYSRPKDKRGGAWMDECLTRRRVDGRVQHPVAHLVCNATPPVGDRPALMTFREVETLFHEFGHGLQHMLTTVDYCDAAGINGVEWDAVELASQFMENWCYHKPTLVGLSRHYETGQPLPDQLFEKIQAAKTYRSGSSMQRQLLFGITDMELHTNFDPDGSQSPFELHRRVSREISVMPILPEDRSLCSFQHIFAGGYAAGYYSYKWAEVLSADAFSAFEDAGLDDDRAVRETGRRFRNTILARGGGRHPMQVFKDFRGREPNSEALLRHSGLISDEVA